MDWEDFGVMLKGLLHFTRTYDNVEFYYDVLQDDSGLLGTGALSKW